MIACDICGKKLKTTQGLRGHKYFFHDELEKNDQHPEAQHLAEPPLSFRSATRLSNEDRLGKIENRVTNLESTTGIKEPSLQNDFLHVADKPLTELVTQLAQQLHQQAELAKAQRLEFIEQVNKLREQVEQIAVTNDVQRAELSRISDLIGRLRVDYDDFNHNVLKLMSWARNNFSANTSDLDLLFQAFDCHGHSGKGTCELTTGPSAVNAFNERLNMANDRRGKLPEVVAKCGVQLFYKDKPDDGKQYVLYKGLGWTADDQRRN